MITDGLKFGSYGLNFDDIENGMELYPDGLELIIKAGWDVIGDKTPIIIQSSVDVIPQ